MFSMTGEVTKKMRVCHVVPLVIFCESTLLFFAARCIMSLGRDLENETTSEPYHSNEKPNYRVCKDMCLVDDQCTFVTASHLPRNDSSSYRVCSYYNGTLQETSTPVPFHTGAYKKQFGRAGNAISKLERCISIKNTVSLVSRSIRRDRITKLGLIRGSN